MAYDAGRQRTVLFGGSNSSGQLADTWEWDGVNWAQRTPATSPLRRIQHAMAYDAARQRTVLFGGLATLGPFLGDTWEWDGVSWIQQSPAASPPARSQHAMAYDLRRQRVVLFGGVMSATVFADLWEWDGSSWVQQSPAPRPTPRRGHAMTYDAARQRLVVFGGWDNVPHGDTWLHGNVVSAASQRIGSACSGANGLPVITSNLPYLGNQTFVLDVLSARASTACVLLLATGTQSLNLGGGCTLYLSGVFVPLFSATNATGFASVRFPIPFDASLRGAATYAQGFVLDPMGSFGGLAFSSGLKLVLGD
jgi:hypothetical protein